MSSELLTNTLESTGYEAVIGMEVHAELLTNSKLFCGCANEFGGEPNTRCCPVCIGLPGALPVANRKAIYLVARAAAALNCHISRATFFHRKNYFYPDLPKAYQISQYGDTPIGIHGWIEIETEDGGSKKIGIRRVHLEEDTGKLIHATRTTSEVDYNRSSVPLMEIVSEHDPRAGFDMITNAFEARDYITKLRNILVYLGVCDGKMEEGSLRCEPNISVRKIGYTGYGTKTELKNLNSFRAVFRGVEFEVRRQVELIESGGEVLAETRRWDDENGITARMRGKEQEQEYRYFPEPDLLPFEFTDQQVEEIQATVPELPISRKKRFIALGITSDDATTLTDDRALAEFFDKAVDATGDAKLAANWILGDLLKLLNQSSIPLSECKVTAEGLAELLKLIADGTISGKIAKTVFEEMFKSGKSPEAIVKESGQTQISDEGVITEAIQAIVDDPANNRQLQGYLGGNEKMMGYFVGQAMKATAGRANPQLVNKLLKRMLDSRKG